ncbi:MAG: hypothetical protein HY873_00755 [Chloroflexi bacterium]|nr:hypothetical protein [Chloroflexota bacterium]
MRPRLKITIMLALAVAALSSAACATARSGAGTPPPAQQSALAVLYDRMLNAISRPGEIYHPTITSVTFQDPYTVTTTSELWIDASTGRARVSLTTVFGDFGEKSSIWIIDGNRWFERLEDGTARKREAVTCRDSESPLLSLLLGCRDFTESSISAPVGEEDYDGKRSVAVLTQGTIHGRSEDTSFTDTLYVDAATFLPVAMERSGLLRRKAINTEVSGGPPESTVGQIVSYEHRFVPAASLESGFFDPASLGYIEGDPAAPLLKASPDFTHYWLGRDVTAPDLPSLALESSFVAEAAARPVLRYRAVLKYRASADEFGGTLVELQEWRADEWDAIVAQGADPAAPPACTQEITVDLGDRGTATILAGYEADGSSAPDGACPATAPDDFSAITRMGAAVIRISASAGSAWNSEAGMRAILAALTPVQ